MNLLKPLKRIGWAAKAQLQLQGWREACRGFCPIATVLVLALVALPGCAQQSAAAPNGLPSRGMPSLQSWDQAPAIEAGDPLFQERRLRLLNVQRQKGLVADTNKLLQLVAELNAELNGPHPGPLSGRQLRKVAEIEKLARSVREKMCLPVSGSPMLNSPMPMVPIMP